MARPRVGEVRRTRTGRGVVYLLRFSYRGERHTVRLGGDWEGWDEQRVQRERRFLAEKLARGEWRPPPAAPEPPPTSAPTFQLEASEWLQRQSIKAGDPDRRSKTIRDLQWRLSVVMDVFGPVPIDRLSYRHAEDLVTRLAAERLEIARAREHGAPLMGRAPIRAPAAPIASSGAGWPTLRCGAHSTPPSVSCATPSAAAR